MTKIFGLCLALSLFLAPAVAQTSNEYKLGMASFQTKKYKEAAIFFLKAMAAEPKNPKAYYYAGYCLFVDGRKEDAFNTFKLLVNTMPNTKEALQAKAFLKQNDRNYSKRLSSTSSSSGSTSAATTSNTESVKNNSSDYYVNRLVRVHKPRGKIPAVSPTFIAEIQRLLNVVPVSVLRIIAENKGKVSIYPSIIEEDYRIQNERPRGWEEGTSWSNNTAFCRGTEIVISQYYLSRTSGEFEDASEEAGAIHHELGHAIDHCLDISDSDEFKHMYRLEAARVPVEMHKKLRYFLQLDEGGPSETWAELFCEKFGEIANPGAANSSRVKQYFPNCYKFLEKTLKELDKKK